MTAIGVNVCIRRLGMDAVRPREGTKGGITAFPGADNVNRYMGWGGKPGMRDYLKRAAEGKADSHRAVEERVRAMLAEIRDGGDEAARAFARELDRWEGDFRVPEEQIRTVASRLPATFKEDFAYCKAQVEGFARRQRDSLQAFEVELAPGIFLGQKLVPVGSVGCYIPGGKYPLISAALMSIAVARVAGVGKHRRLRPAARRRRHFPAYPLRPARGRRRGDLLHRRRPGDGGDGLRAGRGCPRST